MRFGLGTTIEPSVFARCDTDWYEVDRSAIIDWMIDWQIVSPIVYQPLFLLEDAIDEALRIALWNNV